VNSQLCAEKRRLLRARTFIEETKNPLGKITADFALTGETAAR
jgi:hypothetical protein